jgi:hypothetical protein
MPPPLPATTPARPLAYFPETGDSWLPVLKCTLWATIAFTGIQVGWFFIYLLPIPTTKGSTAVARYSIVNWAGSGLTETAIIVTVVLAWGTAACCCLSRVSGARTFYVVAGIIFIIVRWLVGIYGIVTNAGRYGLLTMFTISNVYSLLQATVLPVLLVVLMSQRPIRRITDEYRM